MTKASKFMVALLLVCCLVGCNTTANPKAETLFSSATDNQSTPPAEYAPFSTAKSSDGGYIYRIYDGNTLVEEKYSFREPSCQYVTDTLIFVTVQTGTGRSTNWGFFYDFSSHTRSNTFYWVLDFTESKVITGDPDKVVVESIFADDYYFEFADFDQSLAHVADSIIYAVFTEDNSAVTVTYVVDGTYELATQTFQLPK